VRSEIIIASCSAMAAMMWIVRRFAHKDVPWRVMHLSTDVQCELFYTDAAKTAALDRICSKIRLAIERPKH
jgi:hypothetical protein